jgi:hypothetical protein
MHRFRTTAAALALAAGSLAIAVGPASAADPNDGGTNCHGVYLSYLATSDMAPGQLHQDYGTSVRDVQAITDALCQS